MVADCDLFAGGLGYEEDALLRVPRGGFADNELGLVAVLLETGLNVDEDLVIGHEVGVCDGARGSVPQVPFWRRIDEDHLVLDCWGGWEARVDVFEEVVGCADAGVGGA